MNRSNFLITSAATSLVAVVPSIALAKPEAPEFIRVWTKHPEREYLCYEPNSIANHLYWLTNKCSNLNGAISLNIIKNDLTRGIGGPMIQFNWVATFFDSADNVEQYWYKRTTPKNSYIITIPWKA